MRFWERQMDGSVMEMGLRLKGSIAKRVKKIRRIL